MVDADPGARADLQTQTMQWGYATESLDDREAVLKVLSGGNFHLLIADPGPLEETGFAERKIDPDYWLEGVPRTRVHRDHSRKLSPGQATRCLFQR